MSAMAHLFLRPRILSWALYDFANTIFSMNVVTLYFPLYLVQTLGATEFSLSLAISVSMGISALSSPVLGGLSDMHVRKNHIVAVTTVLCCIATALIPALHAALPAAIFFVVANALYQMALPAYDALLPSIAEPRDTGSVSGYGVALGYGGTVLALLLGRLLVTSPAENHRAFIPTAVAFLLFSIPCFFVREVKTEQADSIEVARTFQKIVADRDLRWYFIGHILYLDAVNTVIAFMAVFLVKVPGFSQADGEVNNFFLFATLFAIVGGFFWGAFVRRRGARQGLLWTLGVWTAVLAAVLLPLEKNHYWLIGPVTGIALGGTWACDRPLLLDLIPHTESGRFFGFYYLTGKVSSIIGPLLFGAILSLPLGDEPLRYRIAFASLLAMIVVAAICIRKISGTERLSVH